MVRKTVIATTQTEVAIHKSTCHGDASGGVGLQCQSDDLDHRFEVLLRAVSRVRFLGVCFGLGAIQPRFQLGDFLLERAHRVKVFRQFSAIIFADRTVHRFCLFFHNIKNAGMSFQLLFLFTDCLG